MKRKWEHSIEQQLFELRNDVFNIERKMNESWWEYPLIFSVGAIIILLLILGFGTAIDWITYWVRWG